MALFATCLALLPWLGFTFAFSGGLGQPRQQTLLHQAVDLGSTTVRTENYDIVKVDLDDGRDYPIYIGTGYSEKEGR